MVLTRKRAAGSSIQTSSLDSTLLSSAHPLASSGSSRALCSSTKSVTAPIVSSMPALNNKTSTQDSMQAKNSSQSGTDNLLTTSSANPPPLKNQQSDDELPQVGASPFAALFSAVEAGGAQAAEVSVDSASLLPPSGSQISRTCAGNEASGGEEPAMMRYIVYHSPQPAPTSTVPSAISMGLPSLFPAQNTTTTATSSAPTTLTILTSGSSLPSRFPVQNTTTTATSSAPTTLTILTSGSKSGSAQRHIIVPISQPSSNQTSLLSSATLVRSANQSIVPKSSVSLLATQLTATPPSVPASPVISSNASFKLDPSVATVESRSVSAAAGVQSAANTISAQLVMPGAFLQIVTKAATIPAGSPTTAVSNTTLPTSSPSTTESTPTPVLHHRSRLSSPPQFEESAVTWSRESTLRLIQLYKEHQAYLNDHHYKKKSVWELIAAKMCQGRPDSPKFTWKHVENKWKNMTKRYRDCVDLNQHKLSSLKCRFYDEIAEIYNYNPYEDQKTAAEGLRALKSGPRADLQNKTITGDIHNKNIRLGSTTMPKQEPLTVDGTKVCTVAGGNVFEHEPVIMKKKKYCQIEPSPTPSVTSGAEAALLMQSQPQTSQHSADRVGGDDVDVVCLIKELREDRARMESKRMERLETMHREKMNMFSKFLDILKQSKQL